MKKLRLKLATWLLGYNPEDRIAGLQKTIESIQSQLNSSISIPRLVSDALDLTRRLYADHSSPVQSGEWKRHQVLAKLIKSGVSESDAGLAIELVHRESKS